MASRVKKALNLIGRGIPDPGAHMYHAADGVVGGGKLNKNKRHKMEKALHRHRLRASGMTDSFYGSKEVGGTNDNPNEYEA